MKTIDDLKNEKDVMTIFRDFDLLRQYIVTVKDLADAMNACLDDNQKFEIIHADYFKKLNSAAIYEAILTIQDENIKAQIIHDDELMDLAFIDKYKFKRFVETLNDESKMYVLNNKNLLQKLNIAKYDIIKIINSMSTEKIIDIVRNKEFLKTHDIQAEDICDIIKKIDDDKTKLKLTKENAVFSKWQIMHIIKSSGIEAVIDFLNSDQEFLQNKNIKLYDILNFIEEDKQLELIEQLDKITLPEDEKRKMIVVLKKETKEKINIEKIDERYRPLLEMRIENGRIVPNLDYDNLMQYAGLDELISVKPMEIKVEGERQALARLCEICPKMTIQDGFVMIGNSTCEEYLKGEEWVNSVLQEIQAEWTDVQKLAYIDTVIGKRISYTPEWETEAQNHEDSRALWRIITRGYGICNGIAQVEQYLLRRIGIESELVSSKNHSFVKVKNIDIPTQNGVVRGDTLVDPTWNLTASRYGSLPHHFCKSYDELRKVDFEENGMDSECHKNEELKQSETINLDIECLRDVYKSIGIADRDGNFPIKQLIEDVEQIDETAIDMKSKISKKFALLKQWCPEFAICQNSTMNVLRDVIFWQNEHFNFEKCVASRVYEKSDDKKQAVLYTYMELNEGEKLFFYADKELGEFMQLSQEEFEARFECYENDLEKITDGKRPWETGEQLKDEKNQSSGEIIAEEGR